MKKTLIAVAFSAALIAGPASAQMYLGLGVGESKTDTRETSWKVYAGYQFNPTWGLELGYNDFDRYRNADIKSYSLAATGTLPLSENWSLIGKLGAAWNRPKFAGSDNHTDALVGLGVGYNMSKNLGLRLEYEDFGKLSDVSTGNNSRGNNVSLSVKYLF